VKSSINLKPVLSFLTDLHENNNKAWFDQNRARYEAARARFEELVEYFIAEINAFEDLGAVSAKDAIFRINRDIRFSKDKTPYKTNFGADIVAGGRKSGKLGYYIHLSPPNQSFVAGGMHMPMPEQLTKFRRAIDRDASAFKKITGNKNFVGYFGTIDGERLRTAPQGYSRDHPEIDLLRLKEVTVGHRFTDKQVLSRAFPEDAVQAFKAMKPFLDYLNRVLSS